MPRFSSRALLTFLKEQLPSADVSLCVAYSGGLDSTVLLHGLARIAGDQPRYRVRAVHIDHQLHADSARWREHCEIVASALQIQFTHTTVGVDGRADTGLEAAARAARYGALRALLAPDEMLLTAHHADDQLETLLLALMRGAGVKGLSAMPSIQPFGSGWLVRPLLKFTRADLETWARSERLHWISDPSNENTGLDRNYLRRRITPALRERWPAAAQSAKRSAAHLAEAGLLLESLAEADVASAAIGPCLGVAELRALEPTRRRNVLRHWIRQRGARAPSTRKLAAIEHDLLMARDDRLPCVEWDGTEVRRHRGLLYCAPRQPPLVVGDAIEWAGEWSMGAPLELPAGLGRLRMEYSTAGGISASKLLRPLRVRFRTGGESLRPAGDAHHRKLKKLLQSSGILPWWRDRLPLVYSGAISNDQLVAVGDLWIVEDFAAHDAESAMRVAWEDKPEMEAANRYSVSASSITLPSRRNDGDAPAAHHRF